MSSRKINWLMILPPVIFLALVVVFYLGLKRDNPNDLPSVMIGKAAPEITVSQLADYDIATNADLETGPKLVNFWASWCAPCRAEHGFLKKLSEEGVEIIGINYKDTSPNAQKFLSELGNPYTKIGADSTGMTGINWGLFGVPETFVIGKDGKIKLRHAGPITQDIYENTIKPALAE